MTDQKEDELVRRSCEGDTAAYAELIHRHSRQVFSICLGIIGHHQDAEDLVQQTLIKGFENLHQLKKGQCFGAWISQVARRLCLDHRRKTQRRQDRLKDYAKSQEPACTKHWAGAMDFSALLRAIQKLAEQDRMALSLYYLEGRSTRQVAGVLDVKESTLLVRLSRARKKLHALLKTDGGVR